MKKKIIIGVLIGAVIVFAGLFIKKEVVMAPVAGTDQSAINDMLTGKVGATTTMPAKVPVPGYIKIGQRTSLGGIFVTPVKVEYDNRCPKDVRCIQAGTLDLGLTLEGTANISQNLILGLGKSVTFDNKIVTLVDATPVPYAGKKIDQSQYRFLVKITHK